MEEIWGSLLSFALAGFGVLGVVATIGTAGAWSGVNQIAQTTALCMAQEGGYASNCAGLIATWESANKTTVTVTTSDGVGVAPIAYGAPVSVSISRGINWGLVTLTVSSNATALSTYLPGSGPATTYETP